jgi:predicted DNA binding protein
MVLPGDLWVAELSRERPGSTFRLLAGVPGEDRALELGEVRADDPVSAVRAMRNHPDIHDCDRLVADSERALVQYETDDQRLYEFLLSSELPPEFPLAVERGEMEFDLTADRAAFDAFGATLDAMGVEYDLLMAVHAAGDDGLLTDRQRECLLVAQRAGYFEVPRACTMADLADELGVDKSTVSETLRRATAQVVEQFLLDGS